MPTPLIHSPPQPNPPDTASAAAGLGALTVSEQFRDLRPMGGCRVIYADPAWRFRLFSDKGERKSAQAQYDCMTIEQIKALPVELLAAEDASLWLWATWPMLAEAMQTIEAWGFTYKTGGAWHKKTVNGKSAFGTGYIFRSTTEPYLIATRGAGAKISSRSERNVIEAAVREHSRKPDEAYDIIERLWPGPYVELFARARRPGWKSWGDEIGKFEGKANGTEHQPGE